MTTYFHRLVAAGAEAKFRVRSGVDPTSAVTAGRTALKEALRLAPSSADAYVEAARLDLVEADWAARVGHASSLTKARADAEKAVALDGQFAEASLMAAEVCLRIATAERSRAVVDSGVGYVDRALALNPRLARAQTVRAALLRLRAP